MSLSSRRHASRSEPAEDFYWETDDLKELEYHVNRFAHVDAWVLCRHLNVCAQKDVDLARKLAQSVQTRFDRNHPFYREAEFIKIHDDQFIALGRDGWYCRWNFLSNEVDMCVVRDALANIHKKMKRSRVSDPDMVKLLDELIARQPKLDPHHYGRTAGHWATPEQQNWCSEMEPTPEPPQPVGIGSAPAATPVDVASTLDGEDAAFRAMLVRTAARLP